jgi:hypothetical protein
MQMRRCANSVDTGLIACQVNAEIDDALSIGKGHTP